MHVGDLDASATLTGKTWTARVTIAAHTNAEAPVAGAAVLGTWGGLTGTCITASNGRCTIQLTKIPGAQASIGFAVFGVSATGRIYAGGANHDPDGDSDGYIDHGQPTVTRWRRRAIRSRSRRARTFGAVQPRTGPA